MKKILSDKEYKELAERNAKHLAGLHIEVGNAPKIAEAFKDIEVAEALEFLFHEAEKYRKENRLKKAAVILEAAELIDRKTGERTELVLESSGTGKDEDTKLYMRRYTPREIFESPI